MGLRKPTEREAGAIKFLFAKGGRSDLLGVDLNNLLVEDTDHEGIGGLALHPEGERASPGSRWFGRCLSETEFNDVDGKRVLVSLYVDQDGEALELDVWKVNHDPLLGALPEFIR